MDNQDDYVPSAGAGYLFGTAALLSVAFAAYLLLVGAIARGIQVAQGRTR